jgi:hypothetical protein
MGDTPLTDSSSAQKSMEESDGGFAVSLHYSIRTRVSEWCSSTVPSTVVIGDYVCLQSSHFTDGRPPKHGRRCHSYVLCREKSTSCMKIERIPKRRRTIGTWYDHGQS